MRKWWGEFYEVFFLNSAHGVWLAELEPPLPTCLPFDQQIEHLRNFTRLKECNEAFANMFGREHPSALKRSVFQRYVFKLDATKTETLRKFVEQQYRIYEAVSFDMDRRGRVVYVVNSMTGIVRDSKLVRVWGLRRIVKARGSGELALVEAMSNLTERQISVLRMTASGHTLKEIGARLGVSPHTVETHRLRLLKKFKARTVPDLVRRVTEIGFDVENESRS